MAKIFIFDPLTHFDCQIVVGNKRERYRYVYPLNPSDVVTLCTKLYWEEHNKCKKQLNFYFFLLTLKQEQFYLAYTVLLFILYIDHIC